MKNTDTLQTSMVQFTPKPCDSPTAERAPPPPCGHRPCPHSARAGHYINTDVRQHRHAYINEKVLGLHRNVYINEDFIGLHRNVYIHEDFFHPRSDTFGDHAYNVQVLEEDDGSGTYVSTDTLQGRNNSRFTHRMPNNVHLQPKRCSYYCPNEHFTHSHTQPMSDDQNSMEMKTIYEVVVPNNEENRRNEQNLQKDHNDLYEKPGSIWYQPKSSRPTVSPRGGSQMDTNDHPNSCGNQNTKASQGLTNNEDHEYVEMRQNNNWNHQLSGRPFPCCPIHQNHQGTFPGSPHYKNHQVKGEALPKLCRSRSHQQYVNEQTIPRRSRYESHQGTIQHVHQNQEGPLRNSPNCQSHTPSAVQLPESSSQPKHTAESVPCPRLSSEMKCKLWVQNVNRKLNTGCNMMNEGPFSGTMLKKDNANILSNNGTSEQKGWFDEPPVPSICCEVSREELSSVWISHLGDTSDFSDENVSHDLDIQIRPVQGRLRGIRPPTHFTNSDASETTHNDYTMNILPFNPGMLPQAAMIHSKVQEFNIEMQRLCQEDLAYTGTHAIELFSEDEGEDYCGMQLSFNRDNKHSADDTLCEQEQTARKLSFSSQNEATQLKCRGSEMFQVKADNTMQRCSAVVFDDEISEIEHVSQKEDKQIIQYTVTSDTIGEAQEDGEETVFAEHVNSLNQDYVVSSSPTWSQPKDNPLLYLMPTSESTVSTGKSGLPEIPTQYSDNSTKGKAVCSCYHSECCTLQNKLTGCNYDCGVSRRKRESVTNRNIVESSIDNTMDPSSTWTDFATVPAGPTVTLPHGQPQDLQENTPKQNCPVTSSLSISPQPFPRTLKSNCPVTSSLSISPQPFPRTLKSNCPVTSSLSISPQPFPRTLKSNCPVTSSLSISPQPFPRTLKSNCPVTSSLSIFPRPFPRTSKRNFPVTRNLNIPPRPLPRTIYYKMKVLNVDNTGSQSQSHCETRQAEYRWWKMKRRLENEKSNPDTLSDTASLCPSAKMTIKFEEFF